MAFTVIEHPIIADRLARLRDRDTGPADFRRALADASLLLAIFATKDLQTLPRPVTTPLAATEGRRLADERIVLAPILRAGLGMVGAVQGLFPAAAVRHIGVYRNEETREPVPYYVRPPGDLTHHTVLILDPMLATGGSATFAVKLVADSGARDIRLLCVVAAKPGVDRLRAEAAGVRIYALALDPELNERAFIVPGLGDAGDRQFDTSGGEPD